jgi:5-formyltetrahydrofolate cyclo-ligase
VTSPQQLVQRKAALRTQALGRRAGIPEAYCRSAAAAVAALLAELPLAAGVTVSGYWPLTGELDPRIAMAQLERRGHPLALPRLDGPDRPLRFLAWGRDDTLVAGAFGLMEPQARQPELLPDLVLVPLLAFDRRGGRLGYGKGYYDRTLTRLRAGSRPPTAVGVAFAAQEVDQVPTGPHDVPLDAVITEQALLRCDGRRA